MPALAAEGPLGTTSYPRFGFGANNGPSVATSQSMKSASSRSAEVRGRGAETAAVDDTDEEAE